MTNELIITTVSNMNKSMDLTYQERIFMIEKLVETFANVIDSIWSLYTKIESDMMPTLTFCTEILRRSKTTFSTLQVSLFYIFRIKKIIIERLQQLPPDNVISCGRRMFLASLIVASKYLHDNHYQNKAWASITGLPMSEINAAELAFLQLIDYKLYVSKPTFDRWYAELHEHILREYTPLLLTPPSSPFGTKRNTTTTSIQPQKKCRLFIS